MKGREDTIADVKKYEDFKKLKTKKETNGDCSRHY